LNLFEYDKKDKKSILEYAKQLEDKSVAEVYDIDELVSRQTKKSNKGGFGEFIEQYYFGLELNNKKEADFPEADVELKTTGLVKNSRGISVKERLVLSMIDYNEIVRESWDSNSLLRKVNKILLMFYMYEKGLSFDDYKNVEFKNIDLLDILKLPEEDIEIIKKDWEFIVNKINSGLAHELSEGDTNYLGACTKASTSKDRRLQPNSNIPAKPRAFSLKRSYMQSIFKSIDSKRKSKSIAKVDFETDVLNTFNQYSGKSLQHILDAEGIERKRLAKSFIADSMVHVAKKHYGEKLQKLAEFEKSGIQVKNIVLKPNGVPKESMSFEQIDYNTMMNENWIESFIYNKFDDERHLWLVFKASKNYNSQSELSTGEIIFEKAMFWRMPQEDLDVHYHALWESLQYKLKSKDFDGLSTGVNENPVGHIRPKARDSKDLYLLDSGEKIKKYCFWLNNKYVAEQIKENKI
jgi:DNA mismatch repair protein MutH